MESVFCSHCKDLPHTKKHFKPTTLNSVSYDDKDVCKNVGCKNIVEKEPKEKND